MTTNELRPYGFIYITTNLINGKRYIGKKKYSGCWKSYLGSGIELQAAIKKYGKENFAREIIDEATSYDELNEKEKYWIRHFDAIHSDQFYNIAAGGDGGEVKAGYSSEQYEESERLRIAKVSAICRQRVGDKSPTAKLKESDVVVIIQRLLQNDFTRDIAKTYGVSYETIKDIRDHKTWQHLTQGIVFQDIRGRKRAPVKSVLQLSLDGEYIAQYSSARAAGKATNSCYKKISACCHNKRKTTNGFRWQFAN